MKSLIRSILPRSRCQVMLGGALVGCLAMSAGAQEGLGLEHSRPFSAFSASASSVRDSVVAVARAQIGRRYRMGGTTPEGGFDCSGLVRYVLAALQVDLPRTAAQQAAIGSAVARDTTRLRPGDLLTFGRGSRVSHIGIYVGEGRYVHASVKAGRVIETSLSRPRSPLVRIWRGARRVVAADSSSAEGPRG